MRCEFVRIGHQCLREAVVRGKFYDFITEQNFDICVCTQHAETIHQMGNPKPAIPLPKEPITWK